MDNSSEPVMRISKGERIYKIFIFKPESGKEWNFEYRIMAKEKVDGNLEVAAYSYKETKEGVKIKSGITRAPDVPKDTLAGIIQGVMQTTGTAPSEFKEIDMSNIKNIDKQIECLRGKLDMFDVTWLY